MSQKIQAHIEVIKLIVAESPSWKATGSTLQEIERQVPMKITSFLLAMMLLVADISFAEDTTPACPPRHVSVKGIEFLAMLVAYEAFKKDQSEADISKLEISLFDKDDGSIGVLFSTPPKIYYGSDGKVSKMVFGEERHAAPVTYYVDLKTNKIIRRQYWRH